MKYLKLWTALSQFGFFVLYRGHIGVGSRDLKRAKDTRFVLRESLQVTTDKPAYVYHNLPLTSPSPESQRQWEECLTGYWKVTDLVSIWVSDIVFLRPDLDKHWHNIDHIMYTGCKHVSASSCFFSVKVSSAWPLDFSSSRRRDDNRGRGGRDRGWDSRHGGDRDRRDR